MTIKTAILNHIATVLENNKDKNPEEISEMLGITVRTLRSYRAKLREKYGVKKRVIPSTNTGIFPSNKERLEYLNSRKRLRK
jgi:transcription initiation factor IIE alpha subunit